MTGKHYTPCGSLSDYFYRLLNRCVSDREAFDWLRIHIDSGRLIIVPPLPTEPYRFQLTKTRDLVIDTNIDLLDPKDPDSPIDASEFQVTAVTDAPPPPIPDEEPYLIIASGRRLIPRGYVLTPPDPPKPSERPGTAPPAEDKPLAPKPPFSESALIKFFRGLKGDPSIKNRNIARSTAQNHFGVKIKYKESDHARKIAGAESRPGRPKNLENKSGK
jgi:hypothetical protein